MHIPQTYTIPVSSKGQITIPAQIRESIGVGTPGKITLTVDSQGNISLVNHTESLNDVFGSIPGNKNTKGKSVEELLNNSLLDRFGKEVRKED